jgi:hypothetical protein
MPSISTSSEKLRRIRITTITASTVTLSNVWSMTIVLTMSAAEVPAQLLVGARPALGMEHAGAEDDKGAEAADNHDPCAYRFHDADEIGDRALEFHRGAQRYRESAVAGRERYGPDVSQPIQPPS